ncbi:hypothetical protein JWG39_14540 [Desulforhopalus vacuolatus]|nr:hypothetical protein [Desulforhopalus vacuolatus]MBM9521036.1 hypothetical protein [Desulforhopalus vacuolatus]
MPCLHGDDKRNDNDGTVTDSENTDTPRNVHATLSPRGDNSDLTHHW